MARRKTVNLTGIKGTGSVNYQKVWRVFSCTNAKCGQLMKVGEDDVDLAVHKQQCPSCGHELGPEVTMRAPRWKYCRVCEQLWPLEYFDRHSRIASGHQLECRHCKKEINRKLNPLRTIDQHRESAQRRRLYESVADETKIDSEVVYKTFDNKCFRCGKQLSEAKSRNLDHTLPAKLLWPLSMGPTLLCPDCNNLKHEKWPSEVYNNKQLRKLAVRTAIPFSLLSGPPKINPEAVHIIIENADQFIERWIKYPDDIKKVRKVIIEYDGRDIFKFASHVPPYLLEEA